MILKNNTGSYQTVTDILNLTIPPTSQIDTSGLFYSWQVTESANLKTLISASSIVLNDGTRDLSVSEALAQMQPANTYADSISASLQTNINQLRTETIAATGNLQANKLDGVGTATQIGYWSGTKTMAGVNSLTYTTASSSLTNKGPITFGKYSFGTLTDNSTGIILNSSQGFNIQSGNSTDITIRSSSLSIDVSGNDLAYPRKLRFQNLFANPSSVSDGDMWFRSDTDNAMLYGDSRTEIMAVNEMIMVTKSADQTSVGVAAPGVSITFDQEVTKDASFTHSTVTNNTRVYVNDAGWYKVTYGSGWVSTVGGTRNIRAYIYKNGTTELTPTTSYGYTSGTYRTFGSATHIAQFAANDYIELHNERVTGTANADYTAVAVGTYLIVELLRRV